MILIVTYDLKEIRDYTAFYEALKSQGSSWWHYLTTTWLIPTTKTPQELANAIRPYMGVNDFLLVGELGRTAGWLPKEAWEWMNAQNQPLFPGFGLPSYIPPTTSDHGL
jgi:hypothetical protein